MVVRPVDEDARDAAQRVERRAQAAKPLGVAHVVAGVDDEVGLELGEGRDPLLLAVLPRRHVRVGQVQDADRRRARREAPAPHGSGR